MTTRMATLPYYYANMGFQHVSNRHIFTSERFSNERVAFNGSYNVTGNAYYPEAGSLDHWLAKRYFLWTSKFGLLYQIGIHHEPWKLQQADASIAKQTMIPFLPDTVFVPPKVHLCTFQTSLTLVSNKSRRNNFINRTGLRPCIKAILCYTNTTIINGATF